MKTNIPDPSASRSFAQILQRLSRAGFPQDFVRRAILPDWWDDASSANDPALLQDIEIRVARFLDRSVAAVSDPASSLNPPAYPLAHLRRVRDMSRDRLGPAIHIAVRIANAAIHNLRHPPDGLLHSLPTDGHEWRDVLGKGSPPNLASIASDLWKRAIPVIPLEVLPSPSFQGLSCLTSGHPAILLGHKHDEPGRVAFIVSHEAGHIANGDCQPNAPVVDEEDEIADDSPMERGAERYAMRALVGADTVPTLDGKAISDFKELAHRALALESTTGADASAIIFSWARETLDYATATMAVKALYRASGARKLLSELFLAHVDVEGASETDRNLMRCVSGVALVHEAAD